MKRIVVYKNGSDVDGKVIMITDDLTDLLLRAGDKFGIVAKRLFTPEGGEIDDVNLIRDNDILYVSCGERFSKPEAEERRKVQNGLRQSLSADWITLNVGGEVFLTSKSSLILRDPKSMLAKMFSDDKQFVPSERDHNGAYLIDRSPHYFKVILNYLRTNKIILDDGISPQGVLEEARYFGLESMIQELEHIVKFGFSVRDSAPLTRRDVVNALVTSNINSELRFQGINLSGADLSRLDFRHVNLKYADLRGCRMVDTNLSYCIMEKADLSNAILDGALFHGVKMMGAKLEKASLRGCDFEDPTGKHAIMEGVNLKSANLEGSNLASVQLRVATLKNANLKHCDLRAAVLAGADLENCDLTGSNLHETNLRGANLKGASLELMQAAVRMSQTVPV